MHLGLSLLLNPIHQFHLYHSHLFLHSYLASLLVSANLLSFVSLILELISEEGYLSVNLQLRPPWQSLTLSDPLISPIWHKCSSICLQHLAVHL